LSAVLGFLKAPVFYVAAGILLASGLFLLLASRKQSRTQEENQALEELETAKTTELKLQEIIRLKDSLKDLCEKASAVSGCSWLCRTGRGNPERSGCSSRICRAEAEKRTNEIMKKYPSMDLGFFNSLRLNSILAESGLKRLQDSGRLKTASLRKG
jgi:hypothetical protein